MGLNGVFRRYWPFMLAAVSYFVVVLFLGPNFEFPLNDDWVYTKDVLATIANGHYSITNYESAMGIPQVYMGILVTKLFGFSCFHLRLIGIIFFLASIFILDLMLIRVTSRGFFRALVLIAYTFFFPNLMLSETFMTDVPFMVFFFASILFYEKYFEKKKLIFLICGFAIFVVAALQRQFALCIPATLFLIALYRLMRRENVKSLIPLILVTVLSFATYMLIMKWWGTLASFKAPLFERPPSVILELHSVLFYLGLFTLPFIPLLNFRLGDVFRNRGMLICAIFLIVLIPVRFVLGHYLPMLEQTMPYLGNQMSVYGAFVENEVLLGSREEVFPYYGWFLTVVSLFGAFYALYIVVDVARRFLGPLKPLRRTKISPPDLDSAATAVFSDGVTGYRFGTVILLAAVIYTLLLVIRGKMFDRYLITTFVAFAFLLPHYFKDKVSIRGLRRGGLLSLLLISIVSVFYIGLVKEYFSWNKLKWDMASELLLKHESDGVKIHAGYEWNGINGNGSYPNKDLGAYRYIISFSLMPGFDIVNKQSYHGYCMTRECTLYLLGKTKTD